jgi:hypothetical protein
VLFHDEVKAFKRGFSRRACGGRTAELGTPTCSPAGRAVSLAGCLQVEGHIDDARERIVVVSGDGLETQPSNR